MSVDHLLLTGWRDRRRAAALWLMSLLGVPDNVLSSYNVNIRLNVFAAADVYACGGFFDPISQWVNVMLGKLACDASSNLVPWNACCSG